MSKKPVKMLNCQPLTSTGVSNTIGFKRYQILFFVKKEIFCKICTKHENHALNHNVLGTTKDAVKIFVTGTSAVTKFCVSFSLK